MIEKTLHEVERGQTVWISEDGEYCEYIVVDKSATTATLLRNVLLPARRMHSSNVSVYDGCEMDLWLENEDTGFLSRFESNLIDALVSQEIGTYVYGGELTTIARRAFLLSEDNIFGNNAVENDAYVLPFIGIANKKTDFGNASRIGYDANGSAQVWWLRSPSDASRFRYVVSSGGVNYNNATYSVYVRPALSVALATIVIVGDDDKLALRPAQGYRKVDGVGFCGSMENRPVRARAIVNAHNLYDVHVWISNNAKDAEPAWVEVTNGLTAELTNTNKTTEKWEIGVKFEGKSNIKGWFDEPVVICMEE